MSETAISIIRHGDYYEHGQNTITCNYCNATDLHESWKLTKTSTYNLCMQCFITLRKNNKQQICIFYPLQPQSYDITRAPIQPQTEPYDMTNPTNEIWYYPITQHNKLEPAAFIPHT